MGDTYEGTIGSPDAKSPHINTAQSAAHERQLLAVFVSLILLGTTLQFVTIGIFSYAYALESSGVQSIDGATVR